MHAVFAVSETKIIEKIIVLHSFQHVGTVYIFQMDPYHNYYMYSSGKKTFRDIISYRFLSCIVLFCNISYEILCLIHNNIYSCGREIGILQDFVQDIIWDFARSCTSFHVLNTMC